MPPQTEPSEKMKAIWARIPDSHCKGLCSSCCGPVDCSLEERRMLRHHGIRLPSFVATRLALSIGADVDMCPALVDGQCSVYEIRPTICRLWGAGPGMACPWGCEPDVPLSERDSAEILADSLGFTLPPDMPDLILRSRIEPPK